MTPSTVSTAADDGSDVLYLKMTLWTAGCDWL